MSQLLQGMFEQMRNAQTYGRRRDSAVLNAQKTEANRIALQSQDNEQIAGTLIDNNFVDLSGNADRMYNTDIVQIYKTNKPLAMEILNRAPELNTTVTEDNRKIGTKAVDLVENDDGSFSVILERSDSNKRVPLTENRSELGDDVVAKFSADDMRRIGNDLVHGIMQRGGVKSNAGYAATQKALYAQALKEQTRRKVASDAAASAASEAETKGLMSNLDFLLRRTEDLDELKTIARETGVDLTGLEEAAKAEAEAQTAAAATSNATSGTRTANAYEDTSWIDDASPTDRVKSNRLLKDRQRVINSINNKLSDKVREQREARIAQIDAELEVLKEATAADPVGRLTTAERRELNLMRTQRDAAKRNLDAAISNGARADSTIVKKTQASMQEADARIAELQAKMQDKPDTADTSAPEPFQLSRSQIEAAIREAASNPENMGMVRKSLQQRGIRNMADLERAVQNRELPPQEAFNAAVMASIFAGNGDNEKAAGFVQKFMNRIERGAEDYTLDEQIDDARSDETLAVNQMNAQTSRMNAIRQARKLASDLADNAVKGEDKAIELYGKLTGALGNDDLEFSDRSAEETRKFVGNIRRLFALSTQNSPAGLKAQEVLPDVISRVILELGAQKGSSGIWGTVRDIFASDAEAQLGNIAGRLIRNADGEIGIRDPNSKSVVYEGVPTEGEIAEVFGPDIAKKLINTIPLSEF